MVGLGMQVPRAVDAAASFGDTAMARPAPVPALAQTTAPATCSPADISAGTVRNIDLYAKPRSGFPLPGGGTVTVWGYADTAGGDAQIPGPTLTVTRCDTVNVTLHNQLSETSSLSFSGQNLVPDTTGVAPGGTSAPYSFVATHAGTTLYQAGLTATGQRQVAMGLAGALIVRPLASECSSTPTTCAYEAGSTYDDEALVVLNEIDPALNANPLGFNLADFSPKYRLINGKGYPNTDPIPTQIGHRVLFRYVNASLTEHSIGLLGQHQTVLANSGRRLGYPYQVVAETIAAGQSLDTLSTMLGSGAASTFALYEAANRLDNAGARLPNGTVAFGGMLALLTAGAGTETTSVVVVPSALNGAPAVTVSSTIRAASSNGRVVAAEFFIDTRGNSGTGAAMTGTFGTSTVNVSATIPTSALSPGSHTIYVHGKDDKGTWGGFATAAIRVDQAGPTTSSVTVTPNPADGSVPVVLTASAIHTAPIVGAEWFDGADPGTGKGAAMAATASGPFGNPSVVVTATLNVAGWTPGTHTLSVRARDAAGNWGAAATTTLTIGSQTTVPPGSTNPGSTNPGGTSPGGTSPGGTSPGGTAPGSTAPVATGPCSPRPDVIVNSVADGRGGLVVTVAAGTNDNTPSNQLQEIRFGAADNGAIDFPAAGIRAGMTGSSGNATVSLTDRPNQVTFTIKRRTAGQSTMVTFTVVDGCGSVPKFAGGGANAF